MRSLAVVLVLGVVVPARARGDCAVSAGSFTDDLRAAFGDAICAGDDRALQLSVLRCDGTECTATDDHDGLRLRASGPAAARIACDLRDPIGSDRDDPHRTAAWSVTCSSRAVHTAGYGWAPAGACAIEMKRGDGAIAAVLGDFFEHSLGRHDDTEELRVACTRDRCRVDDHVVTSAAFARTVRARGGADARVSCHTSDGHSLGEQSLDITRCAVTPAPALDSRVDAPR